MVPKGAQGEPDLAKTLREIADDLAGLKSAQITTTDAGGTYTATEQALINEMKAALNALYAYVIKTTKA
jgi:hypothetical protein